MNYTQNDKIMSINEGTLVIGVDIAKEVHYARAFDYRGIKLGQVFRFENTREGFESFIKCAECLAERTGKQCSIVSMEQTGHYWFNLGHYLNNEGMKLILVNPFHVKRSEELDDNSPPRTIEKILRQ